MNGVTEILIDEKPVSLRFAYKSMRWFTEGMAADYSNYYENIDGEDVLTDYAYAKLIECGYKNQCLIKEIEPSITFEQFYDWVGERLTGENNKELIDVINVWGESNTSKQLVEHNKKKVTELTNQLTSTELSQSAME